MIRKLVKTFPSINIRSFWPRKKEKDPIVDRENFSLYASGRAALYHGVSCLPNQGRRKILIPSYNCGVEVEAIVRAGYSVKFYSIKKSLEIDFTDLIKKIDEDCGAILIIHYYGFPQPIDQLITLCKDKSLFLIEDCAHSLYSHYKDRWIGQYGDLAIFSLQKTLALPNGGGLLVNNTDCLSPHKGKPCMDFALFRSTIHSLLEYEILHKRKFWKIAQLLQTIYTALRVDKTINFSDFPNEINKLHFYNDARFEYTKNIYFLSKLLLRSIRLNKIIEYRRVNYKYLQEKIAFNDDFRMLFEKLPDGVCPLCFPVIVDSNEKWCNVFKRQGISVFIFGRFSHPLLKQDKFINLNYLKKKILGLPIHQQLNKVDISRLVTKINIAIHQRS